MTENANLGAVTLIDLLDHEIAHGTQRSVAVLYAICFLTSGALNDTATQQHIPLANRAIMVRWSVPSLERVKKMAWSVADAMAPEAGGDAS